MCDYLSILSKWDDQSGFLVEIELSTVYTFLFIMMFEFQKNEHSWGKSIWNKFFLSKVWSWEISIRARGMSFWVFLSNMHTFRYHQITKLWVEIWFETFTLYFRHNKDSGKKSKNKSKIKMKKITPQLYWAVSLFYRPEVYLFECSVLCISAFWIPCISEAW